MPHGVCGVLVALRDKSVALRSSFNSLWSQISPFVHLLKHVRLVGLKDAIVEGHACLTRRDVGLPIREEVGPTWLSRKEGAGLQEGAKEGERWEAKVSLPQAWRVTCSTEPTRLVKSAAATLVRREENGCSRIWRFS